MSAVISGSLAYDVIMRFPGRFGDHILPERIHKLSVAFMVSELRREFGGCAGNIAYTLTLLGERALPLGAAGRDFAPYAKWLDQNGIARESILELGDVYTAQAFINTDNDGNQITAFYPGAMARAHEQTLPRIADARIGIVAPDGRDAMIRRAEEFAAAGIPFLFDPGQGLPMFDGSDLEYFLQRASWLAMNDYEAGVFCEKTRLGLDEIADKLKAVIVTRGAHGSVVHAEGNQYDIPAVEPNAVVDPTGCGDAYRAGLLYGLLHDLEWETTGRIASLAGSIKIASEGTQNHRFTPAEFAARFEAAFGYSFH
ncbi:MAG TPA: carbohydrate kinase family protein [Gammaproteobacteria bacterium]|nr:carbohydrate kinase family protein [Gammaproteobacteria bacterium]